jgi:hypothetical protein
MKRSLFSSLVAALVLSSAPAGADTWEAHANICQPDKGDVEKLDYSNTGLFNESTSSSAKAHCPIEYISDLHTGFNSATIAIRYVDRSSAENVSCTLFINLGDGSPVLTETKTSPAGSSNATQTFTWDISSPIGPNIGGGRQLVIQCTLPKATSSSTRSGVRGITLDTNV